MFGRGQYCSNAKLWKPVKLISIFLLAFMMSFSIEFFPANAGDVKLAAHAICDLKFTGQIEQGDSDKIIEMLERREDYYPTQDINPNKSTDLLFDEYVPTLCFNSKGGNFYEAIRFIKKVVRVISVYTYIDEGEKCFSACAIMFLSGHSNGSDDNYTIKRRIHPMAKIGFHAPYISQNDITSKDLLSRSYRAGVLAVANLLDLWPDFYPRSLMAEFLRVDSRKTYLIDSIGQLAAWNIDLYPYIRPKQVYEQDISNLCFNAVISQKLSIGGVDYTNLVNATEVHDFGIDTNNKVSVGAKPKKLVRISEWAFCTILLRKIDGKLFIFAAMGNVNKSDNGMTLANGNGRYIYTTPYHMNAGELSKSVPDEFTPAFMLFPPKRKIREIKTK